MKRFIINFLTGVTLALLISMPIIAFTDLDFENEGVSFAVAILCVMLAEMLQYIYRKFKTSYVK